MHNAFKLMAGIGALAGAISWSAAANAAYFNRYTDGSWTNVEYNDGSCHYYYSHNSYDNQTKLNKSGDCSRIAIGPDGTAVPVYGLDAPVVVAPAPYR